MNTQIIPGAKVHYAPKFGEKENGIVKSVRGDLAFVVFKCGDDWANYQNYTGQSTKIEDLKPGWFNEKHNKGCNCNDCSDLNGRPYDGWTSGAWVKPYTHY